jgi:asparaginyl-tRNA synthetase
MDFKSEQEKFLCSYYGDQPIFLTNYPSPLKAFYMKENADGQTVANFDLIFPTVGEVVGGSIRENAYETLYQKAKKVGIATSQLA